eukprot:gene11680-14454_t
MEDSGNSDRGGGDGGDVRGCCNRDTALTAHAVCCAFAAFFQILSLITTAYEAAAGAA